MKSYILVAVIWELTLCQPIEQAVSMYSTTKPSETHVIEKVDSAIHWDENGFGDLDEKIISSASGDIDCDGISEKVVVYTKNDSAQTRVLRIYKAAGNSWGLYLENSKSVAPSVRGEIDDPFEKVEIEDCTVLCIYRWGTSTLQLCK